MSKSAWKAKTVRYVIDVLTGCWNWQLRLDKGYGRVCIKGKHYTAHKIYYEQAKGVVPDGYDLDHLCRNRACVNPDHLEPVPKSVNTRRGNSAKLNEQQVVEIKTALSKGQSGKTLATQYGVAVSTIYSIKYGYSWRSVTVV